MATDHDSPIELWRALRHNLVVQIEAATPNGPAKLKLRNTAPTEPDFPRIVFTDIRIGAGNNSVNVRGNGPGALSPGQEHVMDIGIKRIEDASVTVEARVDHRQFFSLQKRATVPDEQLAPAIRKLLEAYKRFDLFGRVDGFLSKLPAVTPATTLADVETFKAGSDGFMLIMRDFDRDVGDVASLEDSVRLRTVVYAYMDQLGGQLHRLKDAAQKGDTAAMKSAREAVAAIAQPKADVERRVAVLSQRYAQVG